MADTKLSDLATATSVDYLYGISGGVSKKVALDALTAAAAVGAEDNGGALNLTAGAGGATSGNGGSVTVNAGDASAGDSAGGAIILNAGHGIGTGPSGELYFSAGNQNDAGDGGSVQLKSGSGGGSGAGNGGTLALVAGAGGATEGNGGDITLTPGTAASGIGGHFILALEEFADDAAAATGGVPVSGWYRTASVVKVRVA